MRTYAALALAALLAGTLAFAAHGASFDLNRIIGKDLVSSTTVIGEEEEIAMGRELAGQLLGASPLTNDPALQNYVNKVGRWIASQSERSDLPWRFGVVETSSINAYSAPGGYILVGRGLYKILENEAQLAGVLGHAVASIARRQHTTIMQKSASLAALVAAFQGAMAQRGGPSGAFRAQQLVTGAEVFARGLDKDAVFEADRVGIVLAARAGYNPYGLVEVLHKLQARSPSETSRASLVATHPLPGERLARLGEVITPRIEALPIGREPPIQPISSNLSGTSH